MSQTHDNDNDNDIISWFNLQNIFGKSGSFVVFSNLCKDLKCENDLNFLKRALTYYNRFHIARPEHNYFKQPGNYNNNNDESNHNCNFYKIDINKVFDDRWDILLMEHESVDNKNINRINNSNSNSNNISDEHIFINGKTHEKFRVTLPISSKMNYLERLWDIHLNNIDNDNDIILEPINLLWKDYNLYDPRIDICNIINDKHVEDEDIDKLFMCGGAMTQCIEITVNKLIRQVLQLWKYRIIQNKDEINLWSKYFNEKYDVWCYYGSHLKQFGYYDKRNNWVNLRLN